MTKKIIQPGTLTRKICKFLVNNPVRAFRNSYAHGNWEYIFNPAGIKYYAYKGEIKMDKENDVMTEYVVYQDELGFWQALAQSTAYTIYTHIMDRKK